MDGMNPTAPGPGHNAPPAQTRSEQLAELLDPALLQDQLKLDHEELFTRADKLIEGVERYHDKFPKGPTNDDESGKAADFIVQINKHAKTVDAVRAEVKEPVLIAQRTIDTLFKTNCEQKLKAAAETIARKVTGYLTVKAEAERKRAREEAAAAAAEAARLAALADQELNDQRAANLMEAAVEAADRSEHAERVVTASSTDLSRTRGAMGSVASLRANWTFRVDDLMELVKAVAEGRAPLNYLCVNDAVLKPLVKLKEEQGGVRNVPGLTIYNDAKAGFR